MGEIMTLEQYAYVAEIIGVIMVVLTLAYLAIQTKQNTGAIQSSVRQSLLQEDRESLRLLVDFLFGLIVGQAKRQRERTAT